jgi:hypothetical protein
MIANNSQQVYNIQGVIKQIGPWRRKRGPSENTTCCKHFLDFLNIWGSNDDRKKTHIDLQNLFDATSRLLRKNI